MNLKPIDLKAAVNRLEDAIITLSGPTLAISGILAGVDLVTGGHIMQSIPAISLTWAICLLISLDFQVLNLAARAHRVYLSKKSTWLKGFEISLAVGIAAAISYVSIQMQSIIAEVNSAGVSINAASLQLGISPVWLIWERSALVLLLIFLSGWLREDEDSSETTSVSSVPQATISTEDIQLILSKLAKVDELEQRVAAAPVMITEAHETPVALLETGDGTEVDEPALDAQLAALLAINQNVTSRDAALIVGRPHSTVYRAMKRLEQPVKQTSAE
jgi:hypothetical protein